MMKLYHTSRQIVEHPDVKFSRKYLDFGVGFYLTPLRPQAVRYADRFIMSGQQAVLNTYLLDVDFSSIRYKRFNRYDEEWLDYVSACRKGMEVEKFDIVEGGIANDKVFNTIDLFFEDLISKEEAIKRLLPIEPNWQICISSQVVIDNHLQFIKSESI